MKSKSNSIFLNFRISSNPAIIFLLIFAFYLLLFSANLFAQNSRPTPTPKSDIPRVISRDADSVRNTNNNDDKSETTNNTDKSNSTEENRTSTNRNNIESTSTKQKKMMLYLDLLTRTEQRAASLQKQLFELLEKQNELSAKLNQLEYQLRPEVIASSMRLVGSLRPEDLREQKKESLELEKSNVETLFQRLEARRLSLEQNVQKADALVEKIRTRFDRIIDDALNEEDELL